MNVNRLSKIKTQASLIRMLEKHYEGSLEAFFAELNKESDRLIRTDLKKALQLTDKTAGLENIIPDNYRAHLYRIWARHYHLSSRYPEAYKLYMKALKLFEKLRDFGSRAKVQKALLDVLMYLGKYDDGIEAGRNSLKYYRRIGSEIDAAQVMTNLGNLYHRLDQNLKALKCYNPAYKIFKKLGNDYAMALVQFNRANVYSNLNDLDEAERLYKQAGTIYRSLGMDLAAGQADYSMAYMAFLRGSYSESVNGFSKSADEFRRLGDRRCLALTELDLTEVNLHLNLYSQAIDDASSVAENFRDLKMSYEQGKAYYFAATGYFAFGDFDMAVKMAGQANSLFTKEQNRPWQILCRFLTARIDSREKRYTRALKSYREIAQFYKRQGDLRHYYDVRLAWFEALVLSGKRASADKLSDNLNKSIRKMAGFQKFIFFMLVGDMYRERSDDKRAASYYRRAIKMAEKLKAAIFPDEIRRFFWMDKLAAYNSLAEIYLENGKNRQAFEILERGKSSDSYSDENLTKGSRRKIPPHLQEERQRLKAYLRKAVMPVGSSVRGVAAAGKIHSAEQRLWKIELDLRKQGYATVWSENDDTVNIEQIRKKLKPEDALLRYVCRENSIGVFWVDNQNFEYIPFDTDIEQIRGLLARLYFMINRVGAGDDDDSIITRIIDSISNIIWKPLDRKLSRIERLYVVPDGILGRMPFYMLNNGDGSNLFEKYEIYMYSATSDFIKHQLNDRAAGRFEKISIVAVSDVELPGASIESVAVSRHFDGCRILSGDDATAAGLMNCLAEKDGLVHLIAHAAQSYENHLFSRILLSDGPLYPFDLISRPVNSGLVVLSGCQTGDPGLYYYNDSLSLAQSVLMAGAGEVVASYWPVADEVTCRFMDAFYKYLSKEANVYGALRKAIVDMKSQSGDIRHWASFYLACR